MTVIGIIPARYQSSRFPAKMLAMINGKTLIQRTYESAKQCSMLDRLVVATDDKRIYDHVKEFGGNVYMTSIECFNGTERLVDAIKRYPELQKGEIFVNIQGDRPCISTRSINRVVETLQKSPQDGMSTLVVAIDDQTEIASPACVKCVFDKFGYALYFSRLPIPYAKKPSFCYKHVGIYAFRKDFLLQYAELPDTPLQLQEDLEQLKVLEHGFRIKTCIIEDESDPSVDYPEDIKIVEQYLCTQNTFL
jgi:3-deoxy-manno-octulosonate cytidylyltransferase (CMP-KDO synthetase)